MTAVEDIVLKLKIRVVRDARVKDSLVMESNGSTNPDRRLTQNDILKLIKISIEPSMVKKMNYLGKFWRQLVKDHFRSIVV